MLIFWKFSDSESNEKYLSIICLLRLWKLPLYFENISNRFEIIKNNKTAYGLAKIIWFILT